MSILSFLYQTLCAFLQIKDRKHIEQNFDSVAGVMPQGWDLGVLGGSKTLAWGYAMAPPLAAHSNLPYYSQIYPETAALTLKYPFLDFL